MTPHHSSDESLADGLRAGRRDAFRRLYDEQHPAIYNLCARILGDREEAKDVTQETFIAAFSDPPAADSSLRLRAWLYRVATNACFNHLRSRRKIDGSDGMVDEIVAPVDEFARAETVAAVEQTLGQLNERYRTALVLKDLHGLPPEEIAEVMEISRPTADVLVHRARASFKTVFAKVAGDVPTPASLALVLAPLTVPAALHLMPPLPHVATPAHPIPPHLAHLAPQPHTGGLLNKLATATTAKIAIGAAAASLLVAGGAAEVARHTHHRAAATPAAATALTSSVVPTRSNCPEDFAHDQWGSGEWGDQHHWREMHDWHDHVSDTHWSGEHWTSAHDSSGSGDHTGTSDTQSTDSHTSSAGHDSGSTSTSHDSSTDGTSSGSHDSTDGEHSTASGSSGW